MPDSRRSSERYRDRVDRTPLAPPPDVRRTARPSNGGREELLAADGLYATLWRVQAGEVEGEAVRELGGADHVVEVGGAGTLGQSLAAADVGGHVHLIGVVSGQGGEANPAPSSGRH